MRGALPLCTPHEGALRPSTPGDFRFTTKVTKGVPGALPLDPVGGPTEKWNTFQSHPPSDALRRSPQKREGATKGRGICHFDTVKQLAFFSPEAPMEETPAAFKPWHGSGGLDGNRGMGTEEVRFL